MTMRLFFILLVILQAGLPCLAQAETLLGTILWVVDGDTYRIRLQDSLQEETVRARHFDTAEKGDLAACDGEKEKARQGTELARQLLPKGSAVWLSDFGRDRYGRLLATITLPDGSDLATMMIRSGLAHHYDGGKKATWCSQ